MAAEFTREYHDDDEVEAEPADDDAGVDLAAVRLAIDDHAAAIKRADAASAVARDYDDCD